MRFNCGGLRYCSDIILKRIRNKDFVFKTYTDISGTILNVKTTKIDDERYNEIVRFEGKSELIIPGWLLPAWN